MCILHFLKTKESQLKPLQIPELMEVCKFADRMSPNKSSVYPRTFGFYLIRFFVFVVLYHPGDSKLMLLMDNS